ARERARSNRAGAQAAAGEPADPGLHSTVDGERQHRRERSEVCQPVPVTGARGRGCTRRSAERGRNEVSGSPKTAKAPAAPGPFSFAAKRGPHMLVRIVGLGPGDPDLLTLGSVKALQAIGRAVTPLAPPDLTKHLERAGIVIVRGAIADPPLFVRGSTEIVAQFVEHLPDEDLAIGILGNPLSDFPGLPPLLRELERRGARSEIVPGFPRAALSAALTMPLVPLP